MTGPAIALDDVGKRFWKLSGPSTLLGSLLPFRRETRSELWALRHVNLEVQPGETVGVLGRNGSGKTTLLSLLSGVTSPTEGTVAIEGRIAPFLSVGVGFHPEMTGRENVRLNGLLLGLTPEEVAERLDDIVAFAEMASFIDTPVKFYSSGMFLRLGFAVAAHADPRVLLIDEVFAVGDLTFQMKCIRRMQELQEAGATIVLVSHSLSAIRDLCPRAIVIQRGEVEFDGDAEGAVGRYLELLGTEGHEDADEGFRTASNRRLVGGATVLGLDLIGPNGPTSYIESRSEFSIRLRVRFDREVRDPVFGINILTPDHRAAYGIHSPLDIEHRAFRPGEETEVVIRLTNHLAGGTYQVDAWITSPDSVDIYGGDQSGVYFFVPAVANTYGAADLDGVISVDGRDLVEERSFRLERGGADRAVGDS